jgi:type IV secretory pathway VirB4 component
MTDLEQDQQEFMEQLRAQVNQLDTVRAGLADMIEEGEENWLINGDVDELKEVMYNLETEITNYQESAGWI